jgi:hypothetical protein
MNLNYLLRDELQYELCICGMNSDADVTTLRKLLRSVIEENISVDVQHLKDVGVDQPYSLFSEKVAESHAQSNQSGSSTQAFFIRMKTRVLHLSAHLAHLVQLGPLPESVTMSHVSLLRSSLDSILQRVTSLEEEIEQEGVATQTDAIKEKHGNVEETQAASVFSSDLTHQISTDEREREVLLRIMAM